jgi:hypothetical protein
MPSHESRSRWRTLVRRSAAASAALLFAMWIASHWTYTSLGIDRETLEPSGNVLSRCYRVRWPGDGSLWLGGGYALEPPSPSRKLDAFDLGGRFFKAPRRPTARSAWNRIGFWRVPLGEGEGNVGRVGECWVSAPGWLPALVLALGLIAVRRDGRDRRRQ